MGWQDAPVVEASSPRPTWMDAPEEGAEPVSQGIPTGMAPFPGMGSGPRNEPPARRAPPSIKERAVGAVEAVLDQAAQFLGGTVGYIGGGIGGAAGDVASGFKRPPGMENAVQDAANEGAQRGRKGAYGVLQALLRQAPTGEMSPTGQEMADDLTGFVGQNLPAVAAGPRGMVGMSGNQSTGLRPAMRAVGDFARAEGDLAGTAARQAGAQAAEAVTPTASPRTMQRVGAAVDAGIPVSPHQLSGNRFVKYLGEFAESIPWAGGEGLKRTRREKLSGALARLIDDTSEAKVLDDNTFRTLQDTAGERIGEITSKVDVPLDSFEGLADVARRDTPDVQAAITTYVKDLQQIADENGGVVPGDVLRKLRTEAQTQQRGAQASKGDLANALDRLVQRIDDAVAAHATPEEVANLVAARRSYAVSKALEPLVAKHADGNFPVSSLQSIIASTKAGKRRVARGEGGAAATYAELGQQVLKEMPSSGTAERSLIYDLATGNHKDPGLVLSSLAYGGAALYNLLGPKLVRSLVERQRQRGQPERFPVGEPTLEQGFEPPRPGRAAPGEILGDLTPDWETAPGAAPAGAAPEVVPTEGLVPAIDETQPMRVRPAGEPTAARRSSGEQIPAVEGRPDLPDTMVTGAPAEAAATDAAGAAMQAPEAALARRQQLAEVEKVRAKAGESPEVQRVLEEHEKLIAKRAAEETAAAKRRADAAELRRAAGVTSDPELKQALFDRAKKLEADEPVPTGKTKEGQPELPADEPKGPIPVGKVREVPVETIEATEPEGPIPVPETVEVWGGKRKPPPETIPVGEATEVQNAPQEIVQQGRVQSERGQGNEGGQAAEAGAGHRVQREAEGPRKATKVGKSKLVAGRVYRDSAGNKAIYQADGTWKEVK